MHLEVKHRATSPSLTGGCARKRWKTLRVARVCHSCLGPITGDDSGLGLFSPWADVDYNLVVDTAVSFPTGEARVTEKTGTHRRGSLCLLEHGGWDIIAPFDEAALGTMSAAVANDGTREVFHLSLGSPTGEVGARVSLALFSRRANSDQRSTCSRWSES